MVCAHPDLVAQVKAEGFNAQGTGNVASAKEIAQALANARRTPGIGDGLIFPKSHYPKPTSIMAMSRAALERAPLRGNIRAIVVLAQFQDVKMAAGAKERMQDLFFSNGKLATGSVTEYYSEVSNKKVSFSGEVVGPFTLSKKMAQYANNDFGFGDVMPNSRTMADEAFEAAKSSVNWGPYDNDGNGYVDAFIVVHAGAPAERTGVRSDIWSVKWVLPSEKKANGVNIYAFLTVSEFARCGTPAHEIGHLVFGWPDLYDTDSVDSWSPPRPDLTSEGIGNWCLMAAGSFGGDEHRPVHPSAWCKATQGWIGTITETENHQVTLQDVKSGFKAHRLWTNGDGSSQEYFLIENRQLTGFDASLPGAGLLVWHIDDAVPENTDENHPKVKLMQADGLKDLEDERNRGDGGDPFPGIANKVTFNATSNPHSKAYSGADSFVSVTQIPASTPSMTFNITVKPIAQPPTGDFNPQVWYRLKNTYEPARYSLDVINDNGTNSTGLLQMARDGNFSGQHWQIKSNGDGTYHLRTLFLGAKRQLDVYGNDKYTPVLQKAGFFSGQFWMIKPWGDGTWHLENAYSGPNLYLDTIEGGPKVKMNSANIGRPTQRWSITRIRDITEPGF
ncbi:M6 metalloprotease [Trematosphaeria pertusa]|uniref:M6 metalloprotease n=1 Tax=Trematosphaeria pertusa TaxID=390896 RepID=A0A6A6I029_9PLEO|nr:M6 metalloprotease [Trematosphaeria pertusa]KAF2243358.1 M6 metalloprotease [Trematosphaeria pertusa]